MYDPRVELEITRGRLKARRNCLFKIFTRNPSNTRLAIDIKLMDDQIANLAELSATESASEINSRVGLPAPSSDDKKRAIKLETKSVRGVEASNVAYTYRALLGIAQRRSLRQA